MTGILVANPYRELSSSNAKLLNRKEFSEHQSARPSRLLARQVARRLLEEALEHEGLPEQHLRGRVG